ncbi:hypothetical protein INR49_024304 [Caranx melampygus]|nr:hypothetical protein INR49_024304 [Caranx melampygus]
MSLHPSQMAYAGIPSLCGTGAGRGGWAYIPTTHSHSSQASTHVSVPPPPHVNKGQCSPKLRRRSRTGSKIPAALWVLLGDRLHFDDTLCEAFRQGNEEAISLFTMQHSAGAKEDRHTKASNNILNMDRSRRGSP